MPANPSPVWSRERIERFAPREHREEREHFYQELRGLGDEDEWFVLAAILYAQQGRWARETERKHGNWYWRQRKRIERQLEEIADDDLVRAGLDMESVVFYEPHEVDCHHGRRTKRCIAIREKLETLKAIRGVLAARGLQGDNAFRRRIEKRATELIQELGKLDSTVQPSTANLADFCTPDLSEPVDARARAEVGGPTWRLRGEPGRPEDDLRDYLLETIGARLHQRAWAYRKASKMIARILVHCLGRQGEVEDLAETIEREWRGQRARAKAQYQGKAAPSEAKFQDRTNLPRRPPP